MRSRSGFSFLFAVTAALVAVPALVGANPTPTSAREFNPRPDGLKAIPLNAAVPMTNAQRMARGLPPNRPQFQVSAKRLAPRASSAADRCAPHTGIVRVDGAGGSANHYIARVPNSYGQYGITTVAGDALSVRYASCDSSIPFDLIALNGIANFPFVGGITGVAVDSPDLEVGSSNYIYVGGTTQTAPGEPPSAGGNSFTAATGDEEAIESAIWSIESTSGALTAHWINVDRSEPTAYIVYDLPADALVLVGDVPAFERDFGSADVVTLTFVAT